MTKCQFLLYQAKEFTRATTPLLSGTFCNDGNTLFSYGPIMATETWKAATATMQLTFKFYLILINFKSPVWLGAKNSPMPASTKITFKVYLLGDKDT